MEGDLKVKRGWMWKRRFVRLERGSSEMRMYKSREAFERGDEYLKRIKLSKELTLRTFPERACGFRLEGKDVMTLSTSDSKSLKDWWNAISRVVSVPPVQPSAVNQRDLSSTCTGIRKGLLFRSSMQYDLSKIRTVIDLRRPEMSKAKRSRYLNVDTEFVRINLVPSSVGTYDLLFLFALYKLTPDFVCRCKTVSSLTLVHKYSSTVQFESCEYISRCCVETCWFASNVHNDFKRETIDLSCDACCRSGVQKETGSCFDSLYSRQGSNRVSRCTHLATLRCQRR